ncbi:MAG: AAA family ATPase [Verrucomicrobiota bacterium]
MFHRDAAKEYWDFGENWFNDQKLWSEFKTKMHNYRGESGCVYLRFDGLDFNRKINSHCFEGAHIDDIEDVTSWTAFCKPSLDNLSPSYSENIDDKLGRNGSKLASILARLMTENPSKFRELEHQFIKIVPQIKAIRSRPERIQRSKVKTVTIEGQDHFFEGSDWVIGQSLLFDTILGESLTADQVSDGTLLTLVLLTAAAGGDHSLLLIDDIECGLHPTAQEKLVLVLRNILKNTPHLQIICTTHSPFILNQMAPEEIHLLALDDDGYCHAKRMCDHPRAEELLNVLSPGELWTAEGESWILEN